MNKIYKVIWSKVRNCYVAVSEIAKRNGKGCTSVNCGAKANRGHAGVALAIVLSLSGNVKICLVNKTHKIFNAIKPMLPSANPLPVFCKS